MSNSNTPAHTMQVCRQPMNSIIIETTGTIAVETTADTEKRTARPMPRLLPMLETTSLSSATVKPAATPTEKISDQTR